MIRFLVGVFGGKGSVGGQVSGTVGARVGGGIVDSISNSSGTSAITRRSETRRIGGDATTVPLISARTAR